MARKRKAPEYASAGNDASALSNTSSATASKTNKPKFDWNAADARGGFPGFTVKIVTGKTVAKPAAGRSVKKQKSNHGSPTEGKALYKEAPMGADVRQTNPYPETELNDVLVRIEPHAAWENTLRYRKFTINSEEFEVGQIVFVKKPDDAKDSPDTIPHWFAKVLEVRAGDSSHVFLRVYWAYRPEDFPAGRQPHHGAAELIVSNHMDIIEAGTVEAIANVTHWIDNPEASIWPAPDQLFWRQSYDITKPKGKQFSTLPKYCIDKAPCNPDEPVVQCPACNNWLHARCLEAAAVKTAAKRAQKSSSSKKPTVSAKLSTADPDRTRLIVTLQLPDSSSAYDVPVKCLGCGSMIDDVEDPESKSSDEGEQNDGIAIDIAIHPKPSTPASPPDSTADEPGPAQASTAEPEPSASPTRSVLGADSPTSRSTNILSLSRLLWNG